VTTSPEGHPTTKYLPSHRVFVEGFMYLSGRRKTKSPVTVSRIQAGRMPFRVDRSMRPKRGRPGNSMDREGGYRWAPEVPPRASWKRAPHFRTMHNQRAVPIFRGRTFRTVTGRFPCIDQAIVSAGQTPWTRPPVPLSLKVRTRPGPPVGGVDPFLHPRYDIPLLWALPPVCTKQRPKCRSPGGRPGPL